MKKTITTVLISLVIFSINFIQAAEQKEIIPIEKYATATTNQNLPVYIPKSWGNLIWVDLLPEIHRRVLYFQDSEGTIRTVQCDIVYPFIAAHEKDGKIEIQVNVFPRK